MAGHRPPLPLRGVHGPTEAARADLAAAPHHHRRARPRPDRCRHGTISLNAEQHATSYTTPRDAIAVCRDGAHRGGAWAWVGLVPLLGLIGWARLGLVPVAATAGALLLAARLPVLAGALAALGPAAKA